MLTSSRRLRRTRLRTLAESSCQSDRGRRRSRGLSFLDGSITPRGITLLEILIVVAIIGLLVALLLPAVSAARAAARRVECANRLRQLGIATNAFEGVRQHYPGFSNRDRVKAMHILGATTSWFSCVIPFIEQGKFADHEFILSIPEAALCPDDGPLRSQEINYPTSYVANAGLPDLEAGSPSPPAHPDVRANGVFHAIYHNVEERRRYEQVRPWLRVSASYVSRHDGTGKTLLFSESVDGLNWKFPLELYGCFVWKADGTIFKINEQRGKRPGGKHIGSVSAQMPDFLTDFRFNRPSSYHSGGGVNSCFCDGHIKFLTEDIDYNVLVQLMTPHGAKSLADVRKRIPPPEEFTRPLPADY